MEKLDIFALVDELQEEIEMSPTRGFSKNKSIDPKIVMEIIEDIKNVLHDELDTSRRITLIINPSATVDIKEWDMLKVCIGDTIDLSVNAQAGYEYYWEPEKSFRYTSGARLPNVKGIMFEDVNVITVRAINEFGCIAYDELIVNAVPCCDVYLPTAFSPNGDGVNDNFNMLLREGQKIVTFQIFDRNGKMVYNNGSKLGWNGKDLDGNEVAQAVYFYRIVYSCSDKQNYEAKGDITLIK